MVRREVRRAAPNWRGGAVQGRSQTRRRLGTHWLALARTGTRNPAQPLSDRHQQPDRKLPKGKGSSALPPLSPLVPFCRHGQEDVDAARSIHLLVTLLRPLHHSPCDIPLAALSLHNRAHPLFPDFSGTGQKSLHRSSHNRDDSSANCPIDIVCRHHRARFFRCQNILSIAHLRHATPHIWPSPIMRTA